MGIINFMRCQKGRCQDVAPKGPILRPEVRLRHKRIKQSYIGKHLVLLRKKLSFRVMGGLLGPLELTPNDGPGVYLTVVNAKRLTD